MATVPRAKSFEPRLGRDTRTRPSGRGWRDLAGEPRWCAQRPPQRGPTVRACRIRQGRIGEPPRRGGWGEPQRGGRSLQQRGEQARSGMPCPDGLDL